ncbi:hypothetical protein CEK25_012488 [Fusarium fujikuroi]|nr:hypothetical protein CEK25_012488 [Fusarium fujikuroi]
MYSQDPAVEEVVRILDANTHLVENNMAVLEIGDLIAGPDVVDLADLAFVKNAIKGINGISCE